MRRRAWALAALLTVAAPAAAHAQIFVASRANPSFAIGPLFIRGSVTPALGQVGGPAAEANRGLTALLRS